MKQTLTLEMPDHFTMACKFMEISWSEMLQEFIESILPAEKHDENDTLKQMLAIRYFIHYASDRNRAHERHSKIKTAFIQDCFMSMNGILGDFSIDDQSPIDQWRKQFITDWQIKWKGLDGVFDQHQSKEHGRTYILNRKIPSFESIGLDTHADIILIKGDEEHIRIESEVELTETIVTHIEAKRLWVSTGKTNLHTLPEIIIHLTYKNLDGLVIHNSGAITTKNCMEVESLGIIHNGRSDVKIEIDALKLDATVCKSGNMVITGTAEDARIRAHRTGIFDGRNLETTVAVVTILGQGSAYLHVEDELTARLRGAGDLFIKGNPRLLSFETSGTGNIKPL